MSKETKNNLRRFLALVTGQTTIITHIELHTSTDYPSDKWWVTALVAVISLMVFVRILMKGYEE